MAAFTKLKDAYTAARQGAKGQQTLGSLGRADAAANRLGTMLANGVNFFTTGGQTIIGLLGGGRRAAAAGTGVSVVVLAAAYYVWGMM